MKNKNVMVEIIVITGACVFCGKPRRFCVARIGAYKNAKGLVSSE